tara:strand:- start:30292 stop:31512 length:1221 start_codon:yes stop_codon:yes gene_type:complete
MRFDILIVGGGHAGAQAALKLRQLKYDGSIGVICDENQFPYERPPLSKEYFAGEKEFDRLLIRPVAFWQDRDVQFLLGQKVTAIDATAHSAQTECGHKYEFGKLIWAAGGSPRMLPIEGGSLPGVIGLRTKADADAMLEAASNASHIVIVGAGYIGLEVAATLLKQGRQVTILEAQGRVLARVAGPELSHFYENEHRQHGADLRLNVGIDAIMGDDHASGVKLAGGSELQADLVVVGIGIIPSVEPLENAGVECSNGVIVNEYCQTSSPDIYAIGDCAAHSNQFAGGAVIRLESVQNANDQANICALHIIGDAKPYADTPWFWSNQYDLKLQTVGLSTGYDECVVRGDMASRSFSVIYLKSGRVIALDCVNAMKDFVQGRKLVEAHLEIAPELLADGAVPLKAFLV